MGLVCTPSKGLGVCRYVHFQKNIYTFGRLEMEDIKEITGFSHNTSPLPQNSKLYDLQKYNISKLKNIRFSGKTLCLTLVNIPSFVVPKQGLVSLDMYFGGIVNENESILSIVVYATLPLKDTGTSTCLCSNETEVVLNLPSRSDLHFSINTNCFLLFSYSNNIINTSSKIIIKSWKQGERNEKKNTLENESLESICNDIQTIINNLKRNDKAFLIRLRTILSRYVVANDDHNSNNNANHNNNNMNIVTKNNYDNDMDTDINDRTLMTEEALRALLEEYYKHD